MKQDRFGIRCAICGAVLPVDKFGFVDGIPFHDEDGNVCYMCDYCALEDMVDEYL